MFKLNIECSKDFEELHIKFKDGTSISTGPETDSTEEPPGTKNPSKKSSSGPKKRKRLEEYLDTDAEFGGVSDEVVHPPKIEDRERSPNVAEELQNLDI